MLISTANSPRPQIPTHMETVTGEIRQGNGHTYPEPVLTALSKAFINEHLSDPHVSPSSAVDLWMSGGLCILSRCTETVAQQNH